MFDWLSSAIAWVQTDSHGDMIFVVLAAGLLCELAFRVVHRFVLDRKVKGEAVENNQRVRIRLRRAPSV